MSARLSAQLRALGEHLGFSKHGVVERAAQVIEAFERAEEGRALCDDCRMLDGEHAAWCKQLRARSR